MGLHVTKYPHGTQQKVSYLVALASGDLEHGWNYRTTVELVDPHKKPNGLEQAFTTHLRKYGSDIRGRGPANIFMFRSGCDFPCPKSNSVSAMPSLTGTRAFAEEDERVSYVSSDDESVAERMSRVQMNGSSETSAVNPESRRLTLEMCKSPAFAETTLSCIILSEENAFDLGSYEATIAKDVENMRQTHEKSRLPKGLYFLRKDHLINTADRVHIVHPHDAGRCRKALTKLTMLDTHSDAGASGATSSPSPPPPTTNAFISHKGGEVGGTPAPSPSLSLAKPRAQDAGKDSTSSRLIIPQLQSRTDQYKIRLTLASIFYDNHLGIHECKWPIPTYLARRVTGWAISHMDVKEMPGDAGSVKRICEIPQVHKNREDTLWYL